MPLNPPGILEFLASQIDSATHGGSGSGAPPVPDDIVDLVTDESGTLAVAYGKHVVRGNLIVNKRNDGPPPTSIIFVALGEGEWDAVEALYYSGDLIDPANYHFHPGTLSSGPSDPVQGIDSYLPAGLTYNKTAYIAVNLPEKYATEDRPDKLLGIYRCLKVPDYDYSGNLIDAGSYSDNPARCAAHAMINRAGLPTSRVNWGSWFEFKDRCDLGLVWDNDGDGVGNLAINSFDCHVVFTSETDLATSLDVICSTAGVVWQDDGEQIRFVLPDDQTVVHHFTDGSDGEVGNIVDGSFSFSSRELQERPNALKCEYRDIYSEFLSIKSEYTDRESLRDRVGLVDPGVRRFANMSGSQAQRLLERQMRIESDCPVLAEFRGQGDSLHVLPGDYVTVSHAAANWDHVKGIVIEITDESIEETADERSLIIQRIDTALYSDSDHHPQQPSVAP